MKIYRFRVLLQCEDEEIFRDIDVKENHDLEEFHNCIQIAFELFLKLSRLIVANEVVGLCYLD